MLPALGTLHFILFLFRPYGSSDAAETQTGLSDFLFSFLNSIVPGIIRSGLLTLTTTNAESIFQFYLKLSVGFDCLNQKYIDR